MACYLQNKKGDENDVFSSEEEHYPQFELIVAFVSAGVDETLHELRRRQTQPMAREKQVLPVHLP